VVGGGGGVEGHGNTVLDVDVADDGGIGASERIGARGGRSRQHGEGRRGQRRKGARRLRWGRRRGRGRRELGGQGRRRRSGGGG
jgi:hypothetical protein